MPGDWQRYRTECQIGDTLLEQKKFSESESFLLSAYEGMKAREKEIQPFLRKTVIPNAAGSIYKLYKAWGKKEKMEEWFVRYGDLVFPRQPFSPR
jgi:hypothetical protein